MISLPSAWQHPALTESRYQVVQQLLAEIKGRSVVQRLRTTFVADQLGVQASGTPERFRHAHLAPHVIHDEPPTTTESGHWCPLVFLTDSTSP